MTKQTTTNWARTTKKHWNYRALDREWQALDTIVTNLRTALHMARVGGDDLDMITEHLARLGVSPVALDDPKRDRASILQSIRRDLDAAEDDREYIAKRMNAMTSTHYA